MWDILYRVWSVNLGEILRKVWSLDLGISVQFLHALKVSNGVCLVVARIANLATLYGVVGQLPENLHLQNVS
jgi:hypothetical protein